MSIKKSILVRVHLTFYVVVALALVITFQIINVQVVQGDQWKTKAKETRLRYRTKKATRGNIYGEGGIMLATSIPLYKLSFDPTVADDKVYGQGIDSLSKLLFNFFQDQTSWHDYRIKINNARQDRKRYIILNSRLLNYIEKRELSTWPIFREGQHRGGVLFEKVEERTYPFQELAARTIGYINENDAGAGLEVSFQKYLAGANGKALYQKLAGGNWKPVSSGSRIRPVDGDNIYTTLDINIQDIAHKTLKEALIKHDGKYGCAIVMEVATGEIRAVANLGRVKEGEYKENYNYAIGNQQSTDAGSTFKMASMMALFEDTTLTLKDTIETGGGAFRYYDRVMRDDKVGGWGRMTLEDAGVYSSNIGVSRAIARHFGKKPEEYIKYLDKFGLRTPLKSVQLTGISEPYIKDVEDNTWSGVTLPWMSIGYEMKVSPLQILVFYNAIANNGIFIDPILVKKIMETDHVIKRFDKNRKEKKICSQATLEKIKTIMEGVVQRGTAKNINPKNYKIAGKTGTSRKLNRRGMYIKKYRTSFAGYFPADNPKYSCIVVIDEPKKGGQYGGKVSAPVFRKIADRLYKQDADVQSQKILKRDVSLFRTNLPRKDVGYVHDFITVLEDLNISCTERSGDELVSPNPGSMVVDWQSHKIKPNTIPDLKGMTLRDALYLLENAGLKVFYKGKGKVHTQDPMPGTPLVRGAKVVLSLR